MQPVPSSTPYERLGGADTIRRLVDSLYGWMAKLPEAQAVPAAA
jgi:truncated hemoglobin YjbI